MFKEVRILNDDKNLLEQIGDDQYAKFLDSIFLRAEKEMLELKLLHRCARCTSRPANVLCHWCKQQRYCSNKCRILDWESHDALTCVPDELDTFTIFMERRSSAEYQNVITDALQQHQQGIEFASSLITEFAFKNASICPQAFMEQFQGCANMNDIKAFTIDDTAVLVIDPRQLHYFRVPRHKQAFDLILPMIYQQGVYCKSFDEFVCFVFDELFSQFPNVMDDGTSPGQTETQDINEYMEQYFGFGSY